jgi:hypothetical protein
VDARAQHVRETVERERRLVGDHARALRPEPGDDQLLVLARGVMHEPVQAPLHAEEVARAEVVDEELR